MKYVSLAIICIVLFFSFATFAGNSEERKLGAFHNLTVQDGITVVLIASDKNKAVVTTDGIPSSDVVTELSVFSLTVKRKKSVPNASVTVEIYYTDELDAITTETGVHVLSKGVIYSDKLAVNARFGGVLDIEIGTREIEIQACDATVTVTGKTSKLNVYVLKDAFVNCEDLTYTTKKVSVSGNGIVELKD